MVKEKLYNIQHLLGLAAFVAKELINEKKGEDIKDKRNCRIVIEGSVDLDDKNPFILSNFTVRTLGKKTIFSKVDIAFKELFGK